jgi:hypothetical protein
MQSCQQNETHSLNQGIPRFMKSLPCTRLHLQQTKNRTAIIRIGIATGESKVVWRCSSFHQVVKTISTSEDDCFKKGEENNFHIFELWKLQIKSIKYSEARSRLRWLNGELTNVPRAVSLLVIRELTSFLRLRKIRPSESWLLAFQPTDTNTRPRIYYWV